MGIKVTGIRAWCPQCKEDRHVEDILIVNGSVKLTLECGHKIKERFVMF